MLKQQRYSLETLLTLTLYKYFSVRYFLTFEREMLLFEVPNFRPIVLMLG
jgi:hypothetical protein